MSSQYVWTDRRETDAGKIDSHIDKTILQMFLDSKDDEEGLQMGKKPCFDPKKSIDELIVRESVVLGVIKKVTK